MVHSASSQSQITSVLITALSTMKVLGGLLLLLTASCLCNSSEVTTVTSHPLATYSIYLRNWHLRTHKDQWSSNSSLRSSGRSYNHSSSSSRRRNRKWPNQPPCSFAVFQKCFSSPPSSCVNLNKFLISLAQFPPSSVTFGFHLTIS
nr:uncharacterized protein LOC102922905 isoform X1 [Peromyscus maniculatus bairdii]